MTVWCGLPAPFRHDDGHGEAEAFDAGRQIAAQPARDPLRERRDDDLVEAAVRDCFLHGNKRVAIADPCTDGDASSTIG